MMVIGQGHRYWPRPWLLVKAMAIGQGQSNLNQTLFHSYSEMKVSQLLATSKDPCFRKTFALPVYN